MRPALSVPPNGVLSPRETKVLTAIFRRFPWLQGLLLALLGAIAVGIYAPAWQAPYMFDDEHLILDNEYLRSFSPLGKTLFGYNSNRPLLNLSYALNYRCSGYRTWSYHAVNLAIHVLAVWVFWQILHRVLELGRTAATAGALLYLTMPAASEPVVYLASRSSSLSALFVLAGFYGYARQRDTAGWHRWWRGAASWLAFVAGLATKESAVVLPLLLLLWEWLFRRESRPVLLRLRLWPFLLLFPVLLVFWFVSHLLPNYQPDWRFGMSQCYIIPFYYLSSWLWPVNINADPDPPRWGNEPFFYVPAALFLLGLALLLAWHYRRRSPWLLWGTGWILICFLPTSSLLPQADLAFDRHGYLPAAGWWMLCAWGLDSFRPAPRARRLAAGFLVFAVLACQSWYVRHRAREWSEPLRLWRATVAKSPRRSRPLTNLGLQYLRRQQLETARRCFTAALRRMSYDGSAHVGLADTFRRLHRHRLAWHHLGRALSIFRVSHIPPRDIFCIAGLLFQAEGRTYEAEQSFLREIREFPSAYVAWSGLASVYEERKNPVKAWFCHRRALANRLENSQISYRAGLFLFQEGDFASAALLLQESYQQGQRSAALDRMLGHLSLARPLGILADTNGLSSPDDQERVLLSHCSLALRSDRLLLAYRMAGLAERRCGHRENFWGRLGVFWFTHRRPSRAARAFRRRLRKFPSPEAYHDLVKLARERKRFAEAGRWGTRAEVAGAFSPRLYQEWLLGYLGFDPPPAGELKSLLERSLQRYPSDLDLKNTAGILWYQLGEKKRAIALWQEVINRDLQHGNAWDNLKRAQGEAAHPSETAK